MSDFRDARHLPHHRTTPPDPAGLPRQRRGTTPQMHGRYPDYDVLEQARHWDAATRTAVLGRVRTVPPIRLFTPREVPTLRAFCDVVTAQDRPPRIPVLEMVDDKLHAGRFDGYRYASMPDDRETWRGLARGLDEQAVAAGHADYALCPEEVQLAICSALANGTLRSGVWDTLPPDLTWKVATRAVLEAFYSHPWAWNEIGFGGPAYPRGYARLGPGSKEAWEGAEAFVVDPVRDVAQRQLEP